MIKTLEARVEKLIKENEQHKKEMVPCWTVVDYNRGMIDGLKVAIEMLKANNRDCQNCKHHTENGCSSWDCKFEPKDGCDNDHDCEHCDWTECPVEEGSDDEPDDE